MSQVQGPASRVDFSSAFRSVFGPADSRPRVSTSVLDLFQRVPPRSSRLQAPIRRCPAVRDPMSQEALRAFLRSIPRRPDQVPSSGKLTMEQGIRRYSALAQSTAAHIERWNPGFRRLLGGIQPAHMALAMARRETDFDAGAQNAGSRATGILQVRPSTARELLEDRSLWPDLNDAQFRALSSSPQAIEQALFRPEICMRVGLAYFSQMLEQHRGNVTLALASYNAGPGNVRRAGNRVPANAETQQYVRNIPLYARQVAQLSDRIIG